MLRALHALSMVTALWSISMGASAQNGVPVKAEIFTFEDEHQNAGWLFEGAAGIDRALGNAYKGRNNGYVRSTTGWSGIWREVTSAGVVCDAHAKLRSTLNLTGLYFSILDADTGAVLSQNGPQPGERITDRYRDIYWTAGKVYPRYPGHRFRIRVGFWGNGQDAWAHVDDVVWQCYPSI